MALAEALRRHLEGAVVVEVVAVGVAAAAAGRVREEDRPRASLIHRTTVAEARVQLDRRVSLGRRGEGERQPTGSPTGERRNVRSACRADVLQIPGRTGGIETPDPRLPRAFQSPVIGTHPGCA